MGTDIVPSKKDFDVARMGIYMQLRETTNIVKLYGSLAQGIIELGLAEFIDNEINSMAAYSAREAHAYKMMHKFEERTKDVSK